MMIIVTAVKHYLQNSLLDAQGLVQNPAASGVLVALEEQQIAVLQILQLIVNVEPWTLDKLIGYDLELYDFLSLAFVGVDSLGFRQTPLFQIIKNDALHRICAIDENGKPLFAKPAIEGMEFLIRDGTIEVQNHDGRRCLIHSEQIDHAVFVGLDDLVGIIKAELTSYFIDTSKLIGQKGYVRHEPSELHHIEISGQLLLRENLIHKQALHQMLEPDGFPAGQQRFRNTMFVAQFCRHPGQIVLGDVHTITTFRVNNA